MTENTISYLTNIISVDVNGRLVYAINYYLGNINYRHP